MNEPLSSSGSNPPRPPGGRTEIDVDGTVGIGFEFGVETAHAWRVLIGLQHRARLIVVDQRANRTIRMIWSGDARRDRGRHLVVCVTDAGQGGQRASLPRERFYHFSCPSPPKNQLKPGFCKKFWGMSLGAGVKPT